MKVKTLLTLTLLAFVSLINAQDYQIVQVDPDSVISGTISELKITLNKPVEPQDSFYRASLISAEEPAGSWHGKWSPTFDISYTDSILYVNFNVYEYLEDDFILYLYNQDIYGNSDSISYANPIRLTFPDTTSSPKDYEIVSIEPDSLVCGSQNELRITLNQSVDPLDDVFMLLLEEIEEYPGDPYLKHEWFHDISVEGSLITATINPSDYFDTDVIVYVYIGEMYGAYDSISYDQPIRLIKPFTPDYDITNVTPDFLVPGKKNEIKVTLDKTLGENDSCFVHLYTYEDGHSAGSYWPSNEDISQSDSVITAKISIPDITTERTGYIHLEIIDKLHDTFQHLVYNSPLSIGGNIYSLTPEICMVNTDESNKNMVVWKPVTEDYVDSVIIYKETSVAEEFKIMGKKSVNDPSVFVDEESANAPNSNRYCIAFQDTDGVVSRLSSPHKTMHLTMNVGVNRAINLIWEKYEGFDYSTFHIYRGSSKNNMMKIAELPSNLFTFTDQNPSLWQLYYQVVIENPSPCDTTMKKAANGSFGSVKSNFVEYSMDPDNVAELKTTTVQVFPNPVNDLLTINIENSAIQRFDVEIHDLSGRSVGKYNAVTNGSQIDFKTLKSGIYFLRISSEGLYHNRIIVTKQ